MKKTNMTSEIREYTMNADNPIVIPRNLLEEAGGFDELQRKMKEDTEQE